MRDSFKVYLAGPIRGLTIKSAKEWRIDFEKWVLKETYRNANIDIINPMRNIIWAGEPDDIITADTATTTGGICNNQIVHRDMADVARCDVLVADLSREGWPAVGTYCEITYAYTLDKPIVIWSSWAQNDPFLSVFATKILPDLESCLRFTMDYIY